MSADEDEKAVDQLIAREPGNVAALIRKADLRAGAGDERRATTFYRAALKAAARGHVSAALARELARAEAACERASRRFEEYLEDALTRAGFAPGRRPPRFQESIDIMLGRRSMVSPLQQPRTYFYPGLPQRRYYERHEFPWAAELEREAGAIRDEVLPMVADQGRFTPYLYSDPTRPPKHGLVDNPDWSTLMLWENGAPIAANIEQCPRTVAAVEKLDLLRMPGRAPTVMFSKLRAGAHIEPHTGLLNIRLVCHLPLVVPEGCLFRVGGENRQWREGELLVFDDSVVHEAVNRGGSDRTVLIFEIWRPELGAEEREAAVAMFEAVDSYGG